LASYFSSYGTHFHGFQYGYLPQAFWNLWPLILVIVGLGGLITADREEWLVENKKTLLKKLPQKRKSQKIKNDCYAPSISNCH
jgi:hypothetical protein